MNWHDVLANQKVEVLYNHPIFGVSDPKNEMDLALLKLPFNRHIEVRWDDDSDEYVVDLFADNFRRHIEQRKVASHVEAIGAVREFASKPIMIASSGESWTVYLTIVKSGGGGCWARRLISDSPPDTQRGLANRQSRISSWIPEPAGALQNG